MRRMKLSTLEENAKWKYAVLGEYGERHEFTSILANILPEQEKIEILNLHTICRMRCSTNHLAQSTVPVSSGISFNIFILCLVVLLAFHVSPTRMKAVSEFFYSFPYIFLKLLAIDRSVCLLLMLPIYDIFEKSLDSDPELCRRKRARYYILASHLSRGMGPLD